MSTPLYDYDELETEEDFLNVVARFPTPVPEELRHVYRRLRQFGARRGWAWPYRRYVAGATRRTGRAPAIEHPTAYDTRPLPPNTSAKQSYGHLAFRDDLEYYQSDDSYVYAAPIAAPFDEDGRRTQADFIGNLHQAKQFLGLE
jgi:hypothetical protein